MPKVPSLRLRTLVRVALAGRVPSVLALIAAVGAAWRGAHAGAPLLDDAAFERIVGALEAKRVERHIAGMVLAVVTRDGEPRIHCFGSRDLERNLPVTPETLFSIASTSKTFTAVLAAMAVADGAMTFDDPVRSRVEFFGLADEKASAQCTLRDLLCHRTGLTRTDMLMVAKDVSRRELVEQLAKAEATKPFRTAFQYNNQMFLVVGMATAQAMAPGSDEWQSHGWEALLKSRLLDPLGMKRTTPVNATAVVDDDISVGYRWNDATGTLVAVPTTGFDLAAPAGGIYSTGADMARWVAMLVNRGAFVDPTGARADRRLVPAERLDDLWTQQMEMVPGSGAGYGMGFMTMKWNGRKLIQHGGNLDGFNTQLALLPDEGVGFALLTNNAATTIPDEAVQIVFDAILNPPVAHDPAGHADAPPADVAPLLGCYAFAPAKSTWFVVHTGGGTLGLDVPQQRVYALSEPDADGFRTLKELPVAKLRFDRRDDGSVAGIAFVQSGQSFALPRLDDSACAAATAERNAPPSPPGDPIPVAQLEPYTGTYRFAQAAQDWEVTVDRRGRLAVNVPGQTNYALKWPNAKGRWVFELTDAIEVSFEKVQYADERGNEHVRVDSMTVYQAGMTIAMPRAVPPADLPTTDEVLALVRRASPPNALAGAKTLQVKGAMRMPNQGLDGTLEFSAAGLDRIAQRVDFGRFGAMRSVLSDGRAWIDLPMQGHRILDAGETDELRRQHPMRELDDWTARYESIRVIGRRKLGDVDTIAVRVRAPGGMSSTKYVDTTTGDVVREEGSVLVAGLMALPFTTVNSDFRDVAGARIPFRVVGENDATGRSEVVLESFVLNEPIDEGLFAER
ncbi:MAG: serine hydrolase domain-containing protein [Phycisphaerales bacterium]